MKKIVLLCLVLSLFVSCSKNENDGVKIEENIEKLVIFKDWKDFQKTTNELNESNSDDFISNWIIEKGHASLYHEEFDLEEGNDDLGLNNLTPAFLAIFNKDLKFQVGAEVVSYSKSTFYGQKINSDVKMEIGKIRTHTIQVSDKGDNFDISDKTDIWSNDGYAAVQEKEFVRYNHEKCNGDTEGYSSRRFKYRQQLRAHAYNIGAVWDVLVWVEAKLYINKKSGSNSFKHDVGSRRNYTYNISGTVKFGNATPISYNISNLTRNCVWGSSNSSKWNKLHLAHLNSYISGMNIEVIGTGTITHEVNGNSTSQKWTNPVNW